LKNAKCFVSSNILTVGFLETKKGRETGEKKIATRENGRRKRGMRKFLYRTSMYKLLKKTLHCEISGPDELLSDK
jgi:hypothetical protein